MTSPFDELFRSMRNDSFGNFFRETVDRSSSDLRFELVVDFVHMVMGTTKQLRLTIDSKPRDFAVQIPTGVSDGATLRLKGKAGGDPPGDILLTLRERPHPWLRRNGLDLLVTLPVTALEAVRGGIVAVDTPRGPVKVTLPPCSQNGLTFRVPQMGVAPKGLIPGDLLVTLDVRLPATSTPQLLEQLFHLQASDNPRDGMVL